MQNSTLLLTGISLYISHILYLFCVSGAAAGTVRRKLDGGIQEHQEGATMLGSFYGSFCVLLRSGTGSPSIWDGDLGAVSCNVEKLEGVHVGLLRQVTGNNVLGDILQSSLALENS